VQASTHERFIPILHVRLDRLRRLDLVLTLAPKGCDWLLIGREGELVYVNEYDKGLTAYEAWRTSCLRCAFSEVELVQLTGYPLPWKKNK
jgi:hypothetical protein